MDNNCKSTVTIPLRRYEEMKRVLDSLKQGKRIVVINEHLNPFLGVSQFTYVEEDSVINKLNERVKDLEDRLNKSETVIQLKTNIIQAFESHLDTLLRALNKDVKEAASLARNNTKKQYTEMLSNMTVREFRKYRKALRDNITGEWDQYLAKLAEIINLNN